jgi:basic membrane protein A
LKPNNSLVAIFAGPALDNGFYESGYRGAQAACAQAGLEFVIVEKVGVTRDALVAAAVEAAKSGPRLCLVHGGSSDVAVQMVAPMFPQVQFLSTHGTQAGSNFSSFNIRQPQSAFLAGALAALMTGTGVVGHLSGIRIDPGLHARAAWAQGVAYTNPDVRMVTCFCGTQDDNAVSYRYANKVIDQGVDVLYTMLNFGRTGAIDACRERQIKQIGNVIDWCAVHPDVFIGSAVADNGQLVRQWIDGVISGRLVQGEVRWLGIENPSAVRLAFGESVPPGVRDRINAMALAIADGQIELKKTFDGAEFAG